METAAIKYLIVRLPTTDSAKLEYVITALGKVVTRFVVNGIEMLGYSAKVEATKHKQACVMVFSLNFKQEITEGKLSVGSIFNIVAAQKFVLGDKCVVILVHECSVQEQPALAEPLGEAVALQSRPPVVAVASTSRSSSSTSAAAAAAQDKDIDLQEFASELMFNPWACTDLGSLVLGDKGVNVMVKVVGIGTPFINETSYGKKSVMAVLLMDQTSPMFMYIYEEKFKYIHRDFQVGQVYLIQNLSVMRRLEKYTMLGHVQLNFEYTSKYIHQPNQLTDLPHFDYRYS